MASCIASGAAARTTAAVCCRASPVCSVSTSMISRVEGRVWVFMSVLLCLAAGAAVADHVGHVVGARPPNEVARVIVEAVAVVVAALAAGVGLAAEQFDHEPVDVEGLGHPVIPQGDGQVAVAAKAGLQDANGLAVAPPRRDDVAVHGDAVVGVSGDRLGTGHGGAMEHQRFSRTISIRTSRSGMVSRRRGIRRRAERLGATVGTGPNSSSRAITTPPAGWGAPNATASTARSTRLRWSRCGRLRS